LLRRTHGTHLHFDIYEKYPNGSWRAAEIQATYTSHDQYSYNAARYPSPWVYLPHAARNSDWSGLGLLSTSGYVVMNTSSNPVTVTPYYFDASGELVYTADSFTLNGYGSFGQSQINDPLWDGWLGWIVLETEGGSIIAMIREDLSDSTSAIIGVGN
jgi:hypothetical protein